MKHLFIISLILALTACVDYNEVDNNPDSTTIFAVPENEDEAFEFFIGQPGEPEIIFEPCFTELPLRIYINDDRIDKNENWYKAFRFWAYIGGRDIFEFTEDTINHNIEVIVDESPGNTRAGCGIFIYNQQALRGLSWISISHELGHTLGFLHSKQGVTDGCIMVGYNDDASQGCDIMTALQTYLNRL